MARSIVKEKSIQFSIRIINFYKHLTEIKKEFILSKQIIRSGTSIGANITEAVSGCSKKEFIHKLNISLKECFETEYWLILLKETEFISIAEYESLILDCEELKKLLIAIIKTTKKNAEIL